MNNSMFEEIDFSSIQKYLDKEDVTDISIKNNGELWVTSNIDGHYNTKDIIRNKEVIKLANQVANKMKKEFNPGTPSLEGDIEGKDVDYRISCVHDYLAVDGTTIAIRKVRKQSFLSYDGLVRSNYISKDALDLLIRATKNKANILIVGETGSGKTELLKYLAQHIPTNEVIVTIEDSLEFNLKKINEKASCTSFRVRPGFGYGTILAMILRLNVQRILLQEARGPEVNDLLEAMSTGHNVMTTMHARGAIEVVSRIKQMLKDEIEQVNSLKNRIYSLVDIVVYLSKKETSEGIIRYVDSITEFVYDNINNTSYNNVLYDNGKISNKMTDGLENHLKRNEV